MDSPRDGPPIDDSVDLHSEHKLITLWKAWPLYMAFVMLSFNVELVIMNILKNSYGITGWNLFRWGAGLGNIEFLIWTWLVGKIGIFIKENPGFKNFYNSRRVRGLDKIFRMTIKTVADKLDPENREYLDKLKSIRIGYFDMFLFGVCIGAWPFGIIIFRATWWYSGLAAVMLGNTLKLGLFAAGYSLLGWIFIPILFATFLYKVKKIFK